MDSPCPRCSSQMPVLPSLLPFSRRWVEACSGRSTQQRQL
jgi:hypothetical protein